MSSTLDVERQHLGTPPHVIDMLFTERNDRIAESNASIAAETALKDAETALKDAQNQISKEKYTRAIKHSCRSDWLSLTNMHSITEDTHDRCFVASSTNFPGRISKPHHNFPMI